MSLYGYPSPTTPNLQQLSKKGVLFERAISTAPWTLPAHVSMFTGYYPGELNMNGLVSLDSRHITLAEVLREKGYETAGFVANNYNITHEFNFNQGFDRYEDYLMSPEQTLLSSSLFRKILNSTKIYESMRKDPNFDRKDAAQINRTFLNWLSRRRSDRPFFAFLNYFDAHDPYLPPREFAMKYAGKVPNGYTDPEWQKTLPKKEIHELNAAYDIALAYVDKNVGRLYAELTRRDLIKNTLIIIVSDHGEHFGEHGLLGHSNSLYLSLLWVPLLILLPGRVPEDSVVPQAVSLRDIPATIFDLIQLESSDKIPGNSLSRYWEGQQQGNEMIFSEVFIRDDVEGTPIRKGYMRSLVSGEMHYIEKVDGSEEIYNIQEDPEEMFNLVEIKKYAPMIQFFRDSLSEFSQQAF